MSNTDHLGLELTRQGCVGRGRGAHGRVRTLRLSLLTCSQPPETYFPTRVPAVSLDSPE